MTNATLENERRPFRPVRAGVHETGTDFVFAVEDSDGRSVGILVPRSVTAFLSQMLPTSGDRLVALWQTYEEDRGGGSLFLSELSELLVLIDQYPELAELRKLTGVRTGSQVSHDVLVGKLLANARSSGTAATLVPTAPPARTPDLQVVTATGPVNVEVKTLTRACGADILDEGVAVSLGSARYLRETIVRATRDGREQAGSGGVVVLGVWCDIAGTVAAASSVWRPYRLAELDLRTLVPGSTLLSLRRDGADEWYGLPDQNAETVLCSLADALTLPQSVPIPFTAGAVAVVRSDTWMGVGRSITITDARQVYRDEELQGLHLQESAAVAATLRRFATAAQASARSYVEAVQREPFEKGVHSVRADDRRLVAAYETALALAAVSPHLTVAVGRVPYARAVTDVQALEPPLRAICEASSAGDATRTREGFASLMRVPMWDVRMVRLADGVLKLLA